MRLAERLDAAVARADAAEAAASVAAAEVAQAREATEAAQRATEVARQAAAADTAGRCCGASRRQLQPPACQLETALWLSAADPGPLGALRRNRTLHTPVVAG